jgi:hypothetical protein
MRVLRRARDAFYLFVPVAVAVAGLPACGSSTAASTSGRDAPSSDTLSDGASADRAASDGPTDGVRNEVMPDGGVVDVAGDRREDAPADGSCEALAVWTAASLTFTLTSSGGFVAPPPPDAGCTAGTGVRFDFSLPEATLAEMSCNFSGRVDSIVHLSPAEVASVVASVGAIRTKCARVGCAADAPTTKLTVSASGVQTTYTGDFYSGCPGLMVMPPFVSDESLGALISTLHAIVARACAADGGAADAGACMNR